MAADVKKTGQFSYEFRGKETERERKSSSIRAQKQDSAVIENMKVDVPKKQEGGVFSGHGELRADHLSGY